MPNTMNSFRNRVAITAIAALACSIATTASNAGRGNSDDNYVVAESRFGNGTVVGPVRRSRVGLQVRTPGGNWLHCARSCSETLRVNTVDFWQNEQGGGQDAIDQEDGLLSRWLHWRKRY